MKHFDSVIGWQNLKAVHLNDAKEPFNSHKDRHQQIGKGKIGLEVFARMMNDSRFNGIPLIMETPFSHDYHLGEIMLLRRMERSGGAGIDQSETEHLAEAGISSFDEIMEMLNAMTFDELSEDIQAHFDANCQKITTFERKLKLCQDLAREIREKITDAQLEMIGGSVNGLGSDKSDIDCTLVLPSNSSTLTWQEQLDVLKAINFNLSEAKTELRTGTVPVLRLKLNLGLEIDMNCNQMSSIEDANLLKAYATLLPNFAPLSLVVKSWAAQHDLNDTQSGYLNNYCLILMVLHYLQEKKDTKNLLLAFPEHDWLTPLSENLVSEIAIHSTADDLGKDLLGFFAYFYHYDYENFYISIRKGKRCPRRELREETAHFLIYIEDPFEQKNTSRCVLDKQDLKNIKEHLALAYQELQKSGRLSALI
jgi:DNA polymerase sigma